ncbi:unnamed protein product [Nesidiocoris tenuis]|uniref:Uncharacterized protein n=1 Tax=Nesidiocoris tenuis TaxID=355587 RepID=A0A6H5G527_9HEMI|nr:unnamed protein product [Nesidiocoris tenuis]
MFQMESTGSECDMRIGRADVGGSEMRTRGVFRTAHVNEDLRPLDPFVITKFMRLGLVITRYRSGKVDILCYSCTTAISILNFGQKERPSSALEPAIFLKPSPPSPTPRPGHRTRVARLEASAFTTPNDPSLVEAPPASATAFSMLIFTDDDPAMTSSREKWQEMQNV